MAASPVGQFDGWIVARQGALLVVSHPRDHKFTAAGVASLGAALNGWARDIDLYAVVMDATALALRFTDLEADAGPALAATLWRLECFSKPIVALMTGPVGDIGLALAVAGTHRVAAEGFTYTSESTAARRVPPGNLLALLSRHGDAAMSVLAGAPVGRERAQVLGLATHAIAARDVDGIRAGLAAADPVDPLLDGRQVAAPAVSPVAASVTTSELAALHARVLADIKAKPIDIAIATAHRYDEALRLSDREAATDEIARRAGTVALTLPSRRDLQGFRKP